MIVPWHATVVAPAAPLVSAPTDPATYFRRVFDLESIPDRAVLSVTALGLVEPYLNGNRVGAEVLSPGWTSYRHRVIVSQHDVTEDLRLGHNAVGAIVGQGWARGRLADFTGDTEIRNRYADRAGLFLQLELHYADRVEYVGTDPSFRTSTGPILQDSIYDGETYDARLEIDSWAEPEFDDTSWPHATEMAWDLNTLEIRSAEPITVTQEIAPTRIFRTPSGRLMADFGQNFAGWVRVRVSGSRGTTIVLRHSEILEHGEPAYEPLRRARATDRYTLRGEGEEVWEPRFTFHGFRFVELEGWPGELRIDDLAGVVVHSDMERTGWFETSHELVNRLHQNVVWSMRSNFVGLPTDCPQRDERLGWTGDIHAFGPTAAYLFDVRGVLRSWLADLRAEQRELGSVPHVVPNIFPFDAQPAALWTDVIIGLPWTLYQAYGDTEFLAESYEAMRTYIDQTTARLDERLLLSRGFQFGDWLDPDAPVAAPADGKTDAYLMAQAYQVAMTQRVADIALVLGYEDDAVKLGTLADQERAAFRGEYVAPSGRLVSESATAYALAITFDLLDGEERVRAGERLVALVEKARFRITTGFAGTPLVLEALTRTGHVDIAFAVLLETSCPSFLYPVTMGATTIWERWDSMLPDGTVNGTGMTSFNHYALGAVAAWLHSTVGGLSAAEPGYRSLRIAPEPGPLTSASTTHLTPFGRASVSWRLDGGQMSVEVTIPDGTSAQVFLPLADDSTAVPVGPGTHHWTYQSAAPVAKAELTMQSPFSLISEDAAAVRRLRVALDVHLPGILIDFAQPEAADMTLDGLLANIPAPPEGMRAALADAIAST